MFRRTHFPTDTTPQLPLPPYMGQTFPNICDFTLLTSEWVAVYYVSGNAPIPGRVAVEFAHRMFRKLLAWFDNIDTMLARGDKSTHHCIIFQYVLHGWHFLTGYC